MPHQCTACGHVFPDGSKEMLSGCPDCGGNKFQFHPGEIPADQLPDESPPTRVSDRGSNVATTVGKAANTLRDFVGRTSDDGPVGSHRSDDVDVESHPSTDDPAEAVATEQATLDDLADGRDSSQSSSSAASTSSSSAPEPTDSTDTGRDPLASTREWPSTARPDDEGNDSADATSAGGTTPTPTGSGQSSPTPTSTQTDSDAETIESDDRQHEDSAQANARSAMVNSDELPDAPTDGRVVDAPADERPDLAQLREELNDQFESIRVVEPGQYELNLMELYDREEYIIAIQENGRYVIEVPDTWEYDE